MSKRVFLIVLDSFGMGAAKDAGAFGDAGVNTLRSVSAVEGFAVPNLQKLGFGNIAGAVGVEPVKAPAAAYGRLCEQSMGKDTTTGHWELAGIISKQPMPTYPNGFPKEILDAFTEATGRGVLCNKTYSGTDVIRDYGEEHLKTGKWIVYTSADSVMQIAAHEDVVPVEELYDACKKARAIMQGDHAVGRVIARPFEGVHPFKRTPRRHDYSLVPPYNMLNAITDAGKQVRGVGKIFDIFAGSGVTDTVSTKNNADGMEKTLTWAEEDFEGLCFVNLVDFDMVYGHRQDAPGYAKAVMEFDTWLPKLLAKMGEDDVVMLTADHGCDPCDDSTDHTREDVPLLVWGKGIKAVDLGVRSTFADVAATVCELLEVPYEGNGKSFAEVLQ